MEIQFNCIPLVTIVLPLPNPDDPKQHEACCPLCKNYFFLRTKEIFFCLLVTSHSKTKKPHLKQQWKEKIKNIKKILEERAAKT